MEFSHGTDGFLDLSDRYASLDAKNDPLVEINEIVPWEEFRPLLERVWRKPESERKSRAGRKPMDAMLMFRTLVLGALYNLSDDQVEYQVRDRLSFMRFLGLGPGDRVPDAKTVWLYREALAQAGKVDEVFRIFDKHLARQGYIARGGQILAASIVPVPRNHNTREENAAIKEGEAPEGWEDKPARRSQKDADARWTKKHGKSHYGYKNHVNGLCQVIDAALRPAWSSFMISQVSQPRLKGFRFLRPIISHAVWAYHRFALNLRDVEDLLAERGVIVSYESIRVWCQRFGTQIAARIRRDRPASADKWHLDEVVISIRGRKHWLWRAVDANGDVLEILMQSRRNAHAAKRFLMKSMKRWGVPRVLVTDKLRSYGVAVRDLCPSVDHRSHKGLNNRSEASHRHTRRREKIMGRFKSPRQVPRFLSVHDQTVTIFRPKRHRFSAASYRQSRADAFSLWNSHAAEMVA